jgi:hypothetical protein
MEHGGFGVHGGIAKRGPSSLDEACVPAVSALALMPEMRKPQRSCRGTLSPSDFH